MISSLSSPGPAFGLMSPEQHSSSLLHSFRACQIPKFGPCLLLCYCSPSLSLVGPWDYDLRHAFNASTRNLWIFSRDILPAFGCTPDCSHKIYSTSDITSVTLSGGFASDMIMP